MKKIFIFGFIVGMLLFFLAFTGVFANVDKIVWCHVEPNGNQQTLELPQQALSGHVDAEGNILHAGDHAGACEEISPTPTITEEITPTPPQDEEATPSATVEPTTPPAGHGDELSDGKSDGRSDGRSTLPPCTATTCGWK